MKTSPNVINYFGEIGHVHGHVAHANAFCVRDSEIAEKPCRSPWLEDEDNCSILAL